MKRLLFAAVVAALAAGLVHSVYSPVFVAFWRHHEVVGSAVPYAAFPTVYLVRLFPPLVGIDASLSPIPLVASAFIQWLAAGYLIGGVFFGDTDDRASPGGLRG